ncbi:hypothetical protein GCM10025860_05990 [Methanobacterium ferruginis]|nr:hypothetical protein GCM10025860_05990 [Methanobacterium ferruginis]
MAQENLCQSISWTYNEPTIWFEYTYDSAKLAQEKDLKTVYVTNGYMSEESLDLITPYLDAANVDLKGMSDKFYQELCQARLEPVLENIQTMYDKDIHIEITNLVIPGYNDSEEDLKALIEFIVDVGVEIPLHFTRFYPHYHMKQVPLLQWKLWKKLRRWLWRLGLSMFMWEMFQVVMGRIPGVLNAENCS